MNIQDLWNEFSELEELKQIFILKLYTSYVARFPDDHDSDSYPVSFLEWWTNDYEMLPTVKCTNCMWHGRDDDLEHIDFKNGDSCQGCPNCKTDEYLSDITEIDFL